MSRLHYMKLLFLIIVSIAYLAFYGATWLDIERVWRSSATYNHCYLILPISIWFMLSKRNDLSCNTNYSSQLLWLPSLIVLAMILVWLLAYAADIALFMHIAAVFSLPAIFWLLFGTKAAKKHRFALCYLVFLIPFGEELSLQLQNITADITVYLLHLASIPVFRQGLYLSTPVGMFEVAEACSGLRFLIASLAISTLFAYLNYRHLAKQISFIVFMTILSVIANGIRAFILVYIGEKSNMQLGFGADHYLYGWIFFGLVLFAGFWLGSRFADDSISFKRTPLQLVILPLKPPQLSLMCAMVAAALFSLNLPIVTAPVEPAAALISATHSKSSQSDWGVKFVNSLAFSQLQEPSKIEYMRAVYALKQSSGELFSWQNQLFDKKVWLIQQQLTTEKYTVLHLSSLNGSYRSVLYWYQIDEQRFTKQLATRVQQTLSYYFNSDATMAVNAVSIKDVPPEEALPLLKAAADKLISIKTMSSEQTISGGSND